MKQLFLRSLDPRGHTDRRTYALTCAAGLLLILAIGLLGKEELAPRLLLVAAFLPIWLAFVLLTVRRLRDSGISPWWSLLLFSPVELFSVPLGALGPVNLGFSLIPAIPMLIGLLLPTRPAQQDSAA